MNPLLFRVGGVPRRLLLAAGLVLLGASSLVEAREFRVGLLPNGAQFGCATCHQSASGGDARNPFGLAVGAITGSSARAFWSPTLAALDSDGDGFTNGEELGDPEGDGVPIAGHRVTNPGSASSRPENQAPVIVLTAPVAGTVLVAPAVAAVSAEASDPDGSVSKVEFLGDGVLLGTVTEPPYSVLVDWSLGTHTVTARATDNQGATTLASEVTLTVTEPPAPSLSPASRTAEGGMVLSWEGGGGPFAVQRRAAVADPWCSTVDVVPHRSFTVATTGGAGFFQVADLAGQEAIGLTAVLGGAFERPNPVTGNGSGSGTLTVRGNTLSFTIEYAGLSGPALAAHIHGPASMEASATVMINLAPFNGGAFGTSGTLSGSVILTSEQKAAILSGRTYVNIHTEANQGGEIRGQILPSLMQAVLNGANERPTPVATAGTGLALFRLTGNELNLQISYRDLTGPATRAHIHGPATTEASATVMVDLEPLHHGAFGVAGAFSGTVTLTPEQLTALAGGLTYVNIHTAANGPGEIRGQILPCLTARPFTVVLSGAAERPDPVVSEGSGSGLLALEGNVLLFSLRYNGLSGPAISAHIHGPAGIEESAAVLINLAPFNHGGFGVSGAMAGAVVLTAEQKAALLAEQTYVNVHTDAHRAGEIRGQILRTGNP